MTTPRLLNLTSDTIHIYGANTDAPLVIPSDGELRLLFYTPNDSVSHMSPFHYYRAATDTQPEEEWAIPIINAQEIFALDPNSPGFKHLQTLTEKDSIIVSAPVAHWLSKYPRKYHVLSPATRQDLVLPDEEGANNGQIKRIKALEYH